MKANRTIVVGMAVLVAATLGAFAAWMSDLPRVLTGACNAPDGTEYDLVISSGPSASPAAVVKVGETVTFSATVVSDPPGYYSGTPVWTPYGSSHAFPAPGVYTNVMTASDTDSQGHTCSVTGKVVVKVVGVDLDIDSDHTTDYGGPQRDTYEDGIEEGPGGTLHEGLKFVVVNELHETADEGLPGYADWQIGSPFGPATNGANIFIPIVLEIPPPFSNPTITFTYPAQMPQDPFPAAIEDDETTYPLTVTSQERVRIWLKPMDQSRGPDPVPSGDFVPTATALTKSDLGFSGDTCDLYLEAVDPSATMEDVSIKVEVTETIDGVTVTCEDLIKATCIRVDLDIDSNNDDGMAVPERNLAEDHYEDIVGTNNRPGKIIVLNDDDGDNDKVPDFADGYNRNGVADNDDTPPAGEKFIPLVMEIPTPVDLSKARIRIAYDASDPMTDCAYDAATTSYWITAGHMRIWTKDGNQVRDPDPVGSTGGGDYVKPNVYKASDLGFSGSSRTITLYVEAVACSTSMGDQRIMVELDPNTDSYNPGFIAADAVRTTLIAMPRLLAVTDFFTPRQQESPPYHVCKADYQFSCDGLIGSYADLILEVKEHDKAWTDPFYVHTFDAGTATNTRLYNLTKRYDITGKFCPFYPTGVHIERVCWDGRKDTDGDGDADLDSDGKGIWADCPENIEAPKKEFDLRMRVRLMLPDGTCLSFYSGELTSQTCPLPRDATNDACTGPAPYFGYFRDCVNSKYDSLFLSANSMVPASDGRPTPGMTTYFNGNHWWHTPMTFGWTHTFEMRLMPTRVNGALELYFLGPGNHLFGPADSSGNLWIYGEKATVTELTGGGWVLTNREHTVYTFTDNGQLTEIKDRNSNTVTVALDTYAAGISIKRVASATGAGLTLQLTYDSMLEYTRLKQANISDRTIDFTYFEAPDLFGTNYGPDEVLKTADGPEYNRTFSVTECRRRDPPSRVITGMVTTQQVGNAFFNYGYGTAEDLTTLKSEAIVDSYKVGTNGGFWRQTAITGQTATYTVGRTVTHSYSGNKLQSFTVWQGGASATYTYNYNTYGQRTRLTTANGDTTLGPYASEGNLEKMTPPDEAAINFEYGACNQVKRQWQTSGSDTRETVYALDTCGNVTNITQIGDATVSNRTWLLTRKSDGSIDTVTYPTPSTVGPATCTYDNSLGLVAKITRGGIALRDDTHDTFGNIAVSRDRKGQGTGYVFDKWDRVKVVTYPNTKTESFEYRPFNDIMKHILPPGGQTTAGATNEYQYAGPSGKPTGHTVKGNGIDQTYVYTNVNDEGSVVVLTASEGGDSLQSTYEYDYADRTTSETWAGVANPRWKTKFDLLGNMLESTDGEGNTTHCAYYSDNSAHVLTRPGSFGTVTHNRNGFGNVIEVVDVIGGAGITATTTIEVDPFDRAWRITDPLTNIWTYAFDAIDNVTNVTSPRGYAYAYKYDSRGYPTNCILADGESITIGTDDNGDLSSVTVPKGGLYSYGVDPMRNRLGVLPPSTPSSPVGKYGSDANSTSGQPFQYKVGGRQHVVGRDDGGRGNSHTPPHAPTGASRAIQQALFGAKAVNLMDGVTATRDPITTDPAKRRWQQGPRITETTLNGNGQVKEVKMVATSSGDTTKIATIEYDVLGLQRLITEAAKTTVITHDGHGNVLTKEVFGILNVEAKYDAVDSLKKLTVNGKVVEYGYDGNRNCTMVDPGGPLKMTLAYDKRDMVTNRTIFINSSLYRTESLARDNNGAIVGRTIRNASGATICSESFGRDAADRMTNFTTRTAANTAFLSWAEDSQMTAETWGGTWSLALSSGGLVTGSTASPTFTFVRDAEGKITDVILAGLTIYHYDYDTAGQLKKITDNTDPLGGSAVIDCTLDGTGHPLMRDLPAGAQLTEKLNTAGLVTDSTMTYNGLSRSVTIFRPAGTAVSQIDRPGSAPDTIFGYDTDHQLTSIAHGSSLTVGLGRDPDTGRITTKSLSHLGVTDTYGYHPMGRLESENRSDGSFNASYGYDVCGQRTFASVVDGTTGAAIVFTPPAPVIGDVYKVGAYMPYPTIASALAAIVADRGTNAFATPAVIQLEPGVYTGAVSISVSTLNPTAANPLIIQGRPGARARLDGAVTVKAPNHTHLRGLILGGPVLHTNVTGGAVASCIVTGSVDLVLCNDSFIVGNTFDYAASLTSADPRLAVRNCTNALVCDNIMLVSGSAAPLEESGTDLPDRDYNIYYPSNTLVPAEIHGVYTDPLLHATLYCVTNLASAAVTSGVPVAGFDTDFYGNWRNPSNPCRGAIEVVFDSYGTGGGAFAGDVRDGGGRLVKRALQGREQNLAYDGRNRLTSWGWSGSVSNSGAYVYDHAGRRVRTTIVGGGATNITRYVYDGADVVAEYVDTDSDGVAERTRVYWLLPEMDQRIGFAETTGTVTRFYYYLTDQVGTVLQIVDDAGTVANQYDYDAWGNVKWGSENTFETVENRYLFQGREYDRAAGFYYYRNRIYLPERGEFASPDMNLSRGILDEPDGMGTLAFCRNDPVNNTDPFGLSPRLEYGARWGLSVGFDTKGIYLDSFDFGAAVQNNFSDDWQWEFGMYQRFHIGRSPGTMVDRRMGLGFDLTTFSATLTHGEGTDVGVPQYSLNSMTVSPFLNKFAQSFSWGQTVNINVTEDPDNDLNVNLSGFIQSRNAGNYFFYSNDVDMPPNIAGIFGSTFFGLEGKDRYWTAEALLGTVDADGATSELSWQCFTGDILDRAQRSENNVYDQTPAQQKLNRSEWSLRYSPGGQPWKVSVGRSSSKLLNPQDWVHITFNAVDTYIKNPIRRLFGVPESTQPPCGFFDFDGYNEPRTFFTAGTSVDLP